MDIKQVTLSNIKAGADDGIADGTFQAYASVFDNVDSYGDVVRKGAFVDTLKEWSERDAEIPLLWGHDTIDPFSNIGYVSDAKEDDHGLWVEGTLDLENPKAVQVYRMLKGKRIDQMSFAYDTLDAGPTDVDGTKAWELRKLGLFEVSVVPYGANDQTEVLVVKEAARAARILTDGLKAGRVLSAKNEDAIRAAYDSLGAVLASLEKNDDDAKASLVSTDGKDDTGKPGKSDTSAATRSARARLSVALASAGAVDLLD